MDKDTFINIHFENLKKKFPLILDHERTIGNEVVMRSSITTDQVENFVKCFGLETKTTWNVYHTRNPTRCQYSKAWKCQHSKYGKKAEGSKKNKNCTAGISVRIKVVTYYTKKRDKLLRQNPPLAAIIRFQLNHSHNTQDTELMRYLRVPEEVKQQFFHYFSRGVEPIEAKRLHEALLLATNCSVEDFANAAKNPSHRYVSYVYDGWRRNRPSTSTSLLANEELDGDSNPDANKKQSEEDCADMPPTDGPLKEGCIKNVDIEGLEPSAVNPQSSRKKVDDSDDPTEPSGSEGGRVRRPRKSKEASVRKRRLGDFGSTPERRSKRSAPAKKKRNRKGLVGWSVYDPNKNKMEVQVHPDALVSTLRETSENAASDDLIVPDLPKTDDSDNEQFTASETGLNTTIMKKEPVDFSDIPYSNDPNLQEPATIHFVPSVAFVNEDSFMYIEMKQENSTYIEDSSLEQATTSNYRQNRESETGNYLISLNIKEEPCDDSSIPHSNDDSSSELPAKTNSDPHQLADTGDSVFQSIRIKQEPVDSSDILSEGIPNRESSFLREGSLVEFPVEIKKELLFSEDDQ